MSEASASNAETAITANTWAWWERRRFRYNLGLAAAGWSAYAVNAGLYFAFGHPIWTTWRDALAMTLFLGTGFLVVMGAANVFYLLGAWTESFLAPTDLDAFRRRAFALGFWGSVALPFVLPLLSLSYLVATS